MVKFNPCCCPVQTGLKAIGILQIAKSTCTIVTGILLLVAVAHLIQHTQAEHKTDSDLVINQSIYGTLIVALLLSTWDFILGIILLRGAAQRSHAKCRFWLFATAVSVLVYFIIFVVVTATDGPSGSSIGLYLASLAFDVYCMIAVFAFLDELTSDPSAVGYAA